MYHINSIVWHRLAQTWCWVWRVSLVLDRQGKWLPVYTGSPVGASDAVITFGPGDIDQSKGDRYEPGQSTAPTAD